MTNRPDRLTFGKSDYPPMPSGYFEIHWCDSPDHFYDHEIYSRAMSILDVFDKQRKIAELNADPTAHHINVTYIRFGEERS